MHYFIECGRYIVYELAIFGLAGLTTLVDFNRVTAQIQQMVEKMDLKAVGVRSLYQFSKIQVQWDKYVSAAYDNNQVIRFCSDVASYVWLNAKCQWFGRRIEPFGSQWVSTLTLCQDPSDLKITVLDDGSHRVEFGSTFSETFYNNPDWPKERAADSFSVECTIKSAFAPPNATEMLMLLKSEGLYLSRVVYSKDEPNDVGGLSWTPSSVRFLSIEYSHPKMMVPISLTVDRAFLLEGNHLLSAAFVRRCLEYQNNPNDYYFDTNYKVTLMDDNIRMVTLTSQEYVVLEQDSYRVVKV